MDWAASAVGASDIKIAVTELDAAAQAVGRLSAARRVIGGGYQRVSCKGSVQYHANIERTVSEFTENAQPIGSKNLLVLVAPNVALVLAALKAIAAPLFQIVLSVTSDLLQNHLTVLIIW